MKTWISWSIGVGLAVALFAIAGAAQDDPAPAANTAADQQGSVVTNPPPPDVAAQNLEDAPGKVVSTPESAKTVPATVSATGPLADVVKLVQAGVSEDVLMAYVTNSTAPYNLSSDDIVYLKDIGTPNTVVTTMINRDQFFRNNPPPATEQNPPPQVQTPPAPESGVVNAEPQTAPLTPNLTTEQAAAPNVSYTYFYDSLAPYGNWIDISGYGLCWQPTVVAVNPGWQPYGDSGHWVYTDDGWFWVSDYSWGWAPFHYGRWFRHHRWGWCWAPDTVWGPAWVSWRYTDAYCGWAPLPPTACYRPGFGFTYYGRSVDFSFSFGLSADWYLFIPLGHCYDPHPWRYRMPRHEVTKIYNNTVIVNQYINVKGDHNRIINKGVPVDRVAAAAHTEIKPIRIREHNDAARPAQFERGGKELAVYRPSLPEPKPARPTAFVGEGVKPNPHFNRDNRERRIPLGNNTASQPAVTAPTINEKPGHRPSPATSVAPRRENNGSLNNSRDNRTTVEPGEKPGSLIYRGPNRQKPAGNDVISQPTAPVTPQREPSVRPERPAETPQQSVPSVAPSRPAQTAPLTPESGARQYRNEQRQEDRGLQRNESRSLTPTPTEPQRPSAPAYETPRPQPEPRTTAPSFNPPEQPTRRERQQETQPFPQQRDIPRATPPQSQAPLTPSYPVPREQPRWESPTVRQQPVAPPRSYESRPPQSVPGSAREYRNDNGNGRNDRGNRQNQ